MSATPDLVGDDLLGPQRQARRLLRRQRQGLVAGVRVEALGTAQDRRQRLERGPHDVVVHRLGGQAAAGGLDVEAAHHRLLVLRAEPVAHQPRPHPPRGAELGDLLEQLAPGGEEEAQAAGEAVDVQSPGLGRLDVGDGVGEREGEFLGGGGPGLAHVVAGDGDGVPAGHLAGAELEHVGDQAHRRRRRVDVGAARDVLLEDVVLDRAAEARPRDAAPLAAAT